jgi:hypothetical protein
MVLVQERTFATIALIEQERETLEEYDRIVGNEAFKPFKEALRAVHASISLPLAKA